MKYQTVKIESEEWSKDRTRAIDSIDFALVCSADDVPTGHVTCIEMDKETIYWQLGGALESIKGTFAVVPCYMSMIKWSLERYQRISTRILNTNIKMLHLAMRIGFRIIGVRTFKNEIFLELNLERGESVWA